MNPLNRAEETDAGMVVKQTGDGTQQNTAEVLDDQLQSRTIHILNVRDDRDLRDMIELYVEYRRHGGGEYEKFDYDSEHQCLTVVFVDAKG